MMKIMSNYQMNLIYKLFLLVYCVTVLCACYNTNYNNYINEIVITRVNRYITTFSNIDCNSFNSSFSRDTYSQGEYKLL